LRVKPGNPIITPYQYYSPEVNLYSYSGNLSRVMGYNYFPLHLPFWGEWNVSQGYDGFYTHKGEWGQALDFVLTDESGRTHGSSSGSCDDFYCYNKPVLAPADGTIVELIDDVDDNEPGKVDLARNWGNTAILYHAPGLYTQLSHFRAGSFRVKKGDYVRKGDILGLCGNSGRSPEPHIHFQAQSTPVRGARTISYPFAYYLLHSGERRELKCFSSPAEGERISNVLTDEPLTEAFGLQPGSILEFRYTFNGGEEKEVRWEVFTDAWNARYIYCHSSKSTAWFVNDGTMFYFTAFHGNRESLLYIFYLGAYRILLGYHDDITVNDIIPLHNILPGNVSRWLHDFAAPFHETMKAKYSVSFDGADSQVNPEEVRVSSVISVSGLLKTREKGSSRITIREGKISQFSSKYRSKSVWAERINI
ncbi:MAG TPA: M23 family metallopeptidase, partial [Bacteroidales bacterium]|nr:M23 family metallopeptidase [Bacteroidales bacterium]